MRRLLKIAVGLADCNPSSGVMKSGTMTRCCLLLLISSCAFAQSKNPLTDAFMARYKSIKQNLIESAEAMPEEAYSYKLTPAQRDFGAWISHTVQGTYSYCATIKGEQTPDSARFHDMTGKAVLTKAIKDAFDYCDAALKDMTDEKALAAHSVGGKQVYPVQGMVALLASENEHYGNIVGYMRSKGVTPPSTARASKKK